MEAHLLSSLAKTNSKKSLGEHVKFPAYGLCLSGGNTMLVLIEKIGKYKILAETQDDALGEALDKAARILGFGYPGASVLEKVARSGNPKSYPLPIPLLNDHVKNRFSYSGLKTAFVRLVASLKNPSRSQIADLAACFQGIAFEHIIRVLDYQIKNSKTKTIDRLLFGGGVANNILIRSKLRDLCKKHGMKLMVAPSKKLLGDNAAMIGVAATLNPKYISPLKIDREPRAKIQS